MKKRVVNGLLWLTVLLLPVAKGAVDFSCPNVVVIIADDLGYADMAFLPDAPADVKHYGTPGFDRLAASGTYFRNAYAAGPICSVSRAGLLTGCYPYRWGNYYFGQGQLPEEIQTLPEALHQAGYATAKVGKTHLDGWGQKAFPSLHGFEEYLGFFGGTWDYIRLSQKDVNAYKGRAGFKWMGHQLVGPLIQSAGYGTGRNEATRVSFENDFSTRIFTDKACEYLERNKDGKPFYLHISYNAVHHPTYVVEESWAKKVGARYVPWDREAEEWSFPYWDPDKETNDEFHTKWGHMGEIDKEGRRCYLANLLALDFGISKLLDTLEKTGLRENTLVVFMSDNGGTINTYANNAPLRGYKYMYGEGGIRIPMIISLPGTFPQGAVNNKALVSGMDIFPTIAELAGADVPNGLDGKSILPVLMGEKETNHEWLVWARDKDKWVIRNGKWKLTHNAGWMHSSFKLNEEGDALQAEPVRYPDGVQLFNLENDIGESVNLIAQHPEVAEEMNRLYKDWEAQMPEPFKMKRK
ncbi:sulfatase family protein [Pontiella agarivorans]|uniref:Sulfatase-like hydrolase/transferase n=1 Tax=Pontiella agarivorans TaxID=3038953 RepID=A0ABU5MYR6_9BACT|nr:sulfatase-like hydrolase/transferase [Pontiella agarivorans]MDZ8119330.1 sulfatase-like hydrolase/transferase [Pontiella agarivorans]